MPESSSEWPKGLRSRFKPGRWMLGVTLVFLASAVGYLFTPDCRPILDREVPSFEIVMPLSERAARGEPFRRKGAHWYQCKSRLARLFFF